jgi:glycosyltransferase involved in cell wall biosynthesis
LASIGRCRVSTNLLAELIVVDNGSTDNTRQTVETARLENGIVPCYVSEPTVGKGHAYNAGLVKGRGQVFLFTDDDVRLPVNWINKMTAPILSKDCDAVAGGVRIAAYLERPWLHVRLRGLLAATELFDPKDPYTLVGASMAFGRHVLSKVPWFDPELGPGALGFYEESLFTWQLKKAGFVVGSAYEVIAEHHCDTSRLLRISFLNTAGKFGRCMAYLVHHWFYGRRRYPLARFLVAYAKLVALRTTRWRNWGRQEGCEEWEAKAVSDVGFFSQCLVERKRARNYDECGLVKLRGLLPIAKHELTTSQMAFRSDAELTALTSAPCPK